jgi:probable phosphoglycerate mutase
VLLLRHGETPWSPERRYAGSSDIPLTQNGARQAAAAAARLAGGGIAAIVASPLRRTRQTAAAVSAATGLPVVFDAAWAEVDFGDWEGLTHAEASERWPAEMAAWQADPAVAPPGGESFAAASARVLLGLKTLLAAHPGQSVLVVSHVNPIKIVLLHALHAPTHALRRVYLDVASLSETDWYPDGTGLVRSVNDTAHLRPAPVPVAP